MSASSKSRSAGLIQWPWQLSCRTAKYLWSMSSFSHTKVSVKGLVNALNRSVAEQQRNPDHVVGFSFKNVVTTVNRKRMLEYCRTSR